jgi:hypothetical protein
VVKKQRTATKPLFADGPTYRLLVKLAGQATMFTERPISPSALVRFAVTGPLAELMNALPDMGTPDQEATRAALIAACELKRSKPDPRAQGPAVKP